MPATYAPLPPPSPFAIPKGPLPDAPPSFLVRAALRLRQWLLRLADRLCPADLALLDHTTGLARSHAIGAVASLGVVDALGDEALDAGALARKTGLHPDALHRTLRALASLGIFELHDDGRFSNNRLSRVLEGGRLSRARECAIYFASGSNAAAWADIGRTLVTGQSAFDRVHGMTVWDWFEKHADERENFAHVMMGSTLADAPALAALYPWDEIRTLCDVGGGRGTLLSELVLRFPQLRAALYESASVIESAKELLEARGVADRVELVPGSFFERVPGGYDAYVLKNVLHDWDDPTSEAILRNVRAAMQAGSKLLVCETLVEPICREAIGTTPDLQMMIVCSNGRERGREDFRRLFARAGLAEARVFEFPTIAVIEAVPLG